MIYFRNCYTIAAVMNRYKTLAQVFHPNNGGSNALLAKLAAEHSAACNHILSCDEVASDEAQECMDMAVQFRRVIDQIAHLPDIRLKLAGNELYASGDTYPVRDELRGAGMFYSSKKQAWCIRFNMSQLCH